MDNNLQSLQTKLEQALMAALREKILSNRGSFPPARIRTSTKALLDGLLTFASNPQDPIPQTLGQSFGEQGMSIPSVLEAQMAAVMVVTTHQDSSAANLEIVQRYFGQVIEHLAIAEQAEVGKQRGAMERAYMNTIANQYREQEDLRSTIRELSTPIIPVYEGILVVPLVGNLDSRRAAEVTERLLEQIAVQQAEIVIIDITGVSVIDTSTANHLLMTARAANLLGSHVVLVGIGAEIAQTIIHLGVELKGLTTLANLQAGIAYALERFGLGIRALEE